jgi:hypothetical protein
VLIGPLRRAGRASTAVLADAGGRFAISFEASDGIATAEGGDAVLAAALLPAMKRGEDIEVDGSVSAALLRNCDRIQEVFLTWDRALHRRSPWYQRIDIEARTAAPCDPQLGRGAAAFFTGGVDSFHTAITHRDELAALVYVWGFDVKANDLARQRLVGEHLRSAAAALGLPLIEVTTDIEAVFAARSGIPWLDHHGAALASVAHFLSPSFDRFYVPSTATYAQLESLGSHPLLDPLWSSEAVELRHDGADRTRLEKVRTIAEHEAARRHLRVCWQNVGDRYNCGECEKCVRTAVAARVVGVGGAFDLLPEPTTRAVARVQLDGPSHAWFECREELTWSGQNPKLRWAIELALARRQVNEARRALGRRR